MVQRLSGKDEGSESVEAHSAKQPEEEDEKDENPESQEIEGEADSGNPEADSEDVDAEDPEDSEVIPLRGKVTTATRSLMRWRDRLYNEFKSYFHEICQTYKMRFSTLLKEERTWIENWGTMTTVLRNKAQEGGIL